MTHPREAKGPLRQAHRTRTAAAARHLPRQARRAAGRASRATSNTGGMPAWPCDGSRLA